MRQPFRELKLLVDHREDLVDERRRAQQRLRWHLHQLDPSFAVPLRVPRPATASRSRQPLARTARAEGAGAGRSRARRAAARSRARSSSSTTSSNSGPRRSRRRCSSCPAAVRSPLQSCWPRSARSVASKATRSSLVTAASRPWKRAQAACNATDSTAAATDNSTRPSTGSRSPKRATTRPPRLPRAQTSRRQEPTRSDPLPQTTARTRRLQHTKASPP